ncbi:hypothetical protein PVAP13_3NG178170 [Panicum virgatum]|uniref:Uncharacterized protein n=1 Tax=Panicum virgatum TaxID=38727 RepID=A0A8T0TYQ6_PANVG|nr:hypothetical protein PVAP13_3NG178170 [Panicum virgatum]
MTRGVWGSDRRKDTGMWGGVEGGTRVGDPLGADRQRPPHGAEGLRQCGLVPPPRPGRLLAGWSGRGPERREQGSSSGEHGRRPGLRTRPPPLRGGRDGLGLRGVRGRRDSLRSGDRGSSPRGVPGRDGLRGVCGGEGGGSGGGAARALERRRRLGGGLGQRSGGRSGRERPHARGWSKQVHGGGRGGWGHTPSTPAGATAGEGPAARSARQGHAAAARVGPPRTAGKRARGQLGRSRGAPGQGGGGRQGRRTPGTLGGGCSGVVRVHGRPSSIRGWRAPGGGARGRGGGGGSRGASLGGGGQTRGPGVQRGLQGAPRAGSGWGAPGARRSGGTHGPADPEAVAPGAGPAALEARQGKAGAAAGAGARQAPWAATAAAPSASCARRGCRGSAAVGGALIRGACTRSRSREEWREGGEGR